MSSSAFDSQESPLDNRAPGEKQPNTPAPAESQSQHRGRQGPPHDLFEEVMRETQEICDEGVDIQSRAMDPQEKEAILAVARKFHGQDFALDPVLIELVYAVLRSRLPASADCSDAWREVAVDIAETLIQDPVSSQRLQRFWARLTSSPCAMGDEQ